jgi:predicted sugar kinase
LVDENGAQVIADDVKDFLAERKMRCEAFVSHCRNRGAEITVSD